MSYPNRGGASYSRGGSKAGAAHNQANNPAGYDMGYYGNFTPMMMMAAQQSQMMNGGFPINRQTFGMPVTGYNMEGYAPYKAYIDRIRDELSVNGRFKSIEEYLRHQNEYSLEGEPKKDLLFLDEIKRPKYDYEAWGHYDKFKKESEESIDPSKLILKLCQVVLKMGHQYVPHDQGNRRLRVVQFLLKDKNVLEFTFVCANNKKANKATAIEALKIIFPEIYDIILWTTFDQVGEEIFKVLDEKKRLEEEIEKADSDIYRKCFKGCKFIGDVKIEDPSGRIGNKDPIVSETDESFKERCTSLMFSTISNNLLQKNAGRSLNFDTKILRKVQPEKSLEGEGGNEYEIVATDNHGKKYFRAQLICQNKTDAKQISGLKFIELFAQKVYFVIYQHIMGRKSMDELMMPTTQNDSQEPQHQHHEEPDHGAEPFFVGDDEEESHMATDNTTPQVQRSNSIIDILMNSFDEKDDAEDQPDAASVTSSEHHSDNDPHNKDATDANKSTRLQNDESEAGFQFTAFSVMAEYLKKMFGLEIVEFKGRLPSETQVRDLKDLPSETVLSQNLLESINHYLKTYRYKLLAMPQKHVDLSQEISPVQIKRFGIRFILEKEDHMMHYHYPTTEGIWDYEVNASNAHYLACLNFSMVHLIWRLFPALGHHLAFNSIRSWLGLSDTTRSLQLGFPVAALLTPQTTSKSSVSNSFTTEVGSNKGRGLPGKLQEVPRQIQSDQPKTRTEVLTSLNFRDATPLPSPGLSGSQTPFSSQSVQRIGNLTKLVTELGIRKACEAVESYADKKHLLVSQPKLVDEIKKFERLQGNLENYFEYNLQEFEISGIFFHESLNHKCSNPYFNYDDKIKKKEQFLSHIYTNVKAGDFASALNSVIHSIFKESLDISTDGPYITFELQGQLLAVMNAKVQNKKIGKKVISIVLLRKLWPELYFDHVIKQIS